MMTAERATYRYDVLVMLLAPLAACLAYILFQGGPAISANAFHTVILSVCLAVGLVAEAVTLREMADANAKDKGRLSAFITGTVLSLPLLDHYALQRFGMPPAYRLLQLYGGCAAFLVGTALRFQAKSYLKHYFSHSLRVLADHQVITAGPYRWVRHPAYLGTMLIVLGGSTMFSSLIGWVIALVLAPLAWRRMDNEEKLLIAELGKPYADYAMRVKRVIPWIV